MDLTALTTVAVPGAGRLTVAFAGLGEGRPDRLRPEERMLLATCLTPARRAEFTAGRLAARRAVRALGTPGAEACGPVSWSATGRPLFGPGVTGSLSHAGAWAVAAVAPATRFAGVGVDLEGPAARAGLRGGAVRLFRAPEDDARDLLALFSAKEAVYKAFGGRTADGGPLPLVRIVCRRAVHGFSAQAPGHRRPLQVRVLRGADGSVLTATALPALPAAATTPLAAHPPAAPCPEPTPTARYLRAVDGEGSV